jgi:hypothetical protein
VTRRAWTTALALWLVALPLAASASPTRAEPAPAPTQAPSQAQAPAGVTVPSWNELTPAQREKLAPLQSRWDSMPASRRVNALERMERQARWDALTPEQREALRRGARNFQEMPPELRQQMRASMAATRALPEAERRALFQLWRSLDPAKRRAWLEAGGPGISPPPAAEAPPPR